jgi:hypothetical protein
MPTHMMRLICWSLTIKVNQHYKDKGKLLAKIIGKYQIRKFHRIVDSWSRINVLNTYIPFNDTSRRVVHELSRNRNIGCINIMAYKFMRFELSADYGK